MKLESQFRMTYSMILNLMRVKGMRVEDIMSHSFKESHSRRKLKMYKKELDDLTVEDELAELQKKPFYSKMEEFYEAANQFIELWDSYGVSCTEQLKRGVYRCTHAKLGPQIPHI